VPEISRSQLALYAALALGVALLGARYLRAQHPSPGAGSAVPAATRGAAGPEVRSPETQDGGSVVMHVAGAVRRPGVYRVRASGRVRDAVRKAGGALAQGDANAINLAAKVADGQQVVVPRRASVSGGVAEPAAAGSTGDPAAAGSAPVPISLGSATVEKLQELDGVGPATATKIVAWRIAHGGFRSIDDLGQVPGIGAKRLATLRPLVQP
jgi:competence protein ComEA